jgi:predicted ester cyclase
MEFEENNEEFERKMTRNLKKKHREFFTRGFKDFSTKSFLLINSVNFEIQRFVLNH